MSIQAKLFVLSIPAQLQSGPEMIHPVLLCDSDNVILVDTGMPGSAEQIVSAIEAQGVPLSRLTHIVLTHADADHIGSMERLVALTPQRVEVLCHTHEKPYVQCDVPPLRLAQMEASLDKLSGERLAQISSLVQQLRANYKKLGVSVTRTVEDGEMLPCAGQVIYTPGHTPGHISLYMKSSRVLIAGDMLNVTGGELLPAPEWFAYDKEALKASLHKLTCYDIEVVVCHHGGIYQKDVISRLGELDCQFS